MTETTARHVLPGEQGRSALGRLALLVETPDGTEEVTYERRWHDAGAARAWCETKVRSAPAGSTVVELQVTEEVWGHLHPWDAMANRHIPQTLQLGIRQTNGTIIWGAPHEVGNLPPGRPRT
ncbi:MAG TPA: hypothetical protein VGE14_04285 [Marmoricola sp.]